MNIEHILKTAHISVSHATLKVVVDDLNKYKVLFNPRCTQVDNDVFCEDAAWKKELNFPSFVLSVNPWSEDNTLSVWVEYPYDIEELSEWLKTFEATF